MLRAPVLTLAAVMMLFVGPLAPALEGTEEGGVATQAERAQAGSGYTAFPGYQTLELIQEDGSHAPNSTLTNLITDENVKKRIDDGEFSVLHLSDLAIKTSQIYSMGSTIDFPFAISVKSAEGTGVSAVVNQGTINVAGDIQVLLSGPELKVRVTRWSPSWGLESYGRLLGFNSGIDLTFAKAVVRPELEAWFNADPARIQVLLEMAPAIPKP